MIHFFVDRASIHGIRNYMATRGTALSGVIVPTDYDALARRAHVQPATAIFAGIDQLGRAERAFAQGVYQTLGANGCRVLNEPARVLTRYDLLQMLHERKINRFTSVRATEQYGHLRYPVFIREENRHTGAMSPLLADAFAVERALATLALRGVGRDQLLIVEFCDTRGPDGLYRKYSAFRIDGLILPRHVHISARWVSKSATSLTNHHTIREETEYFQTNPHESWLRDVFDAARIEYGRVDYGVADGRLQVWEINTNPTLGRNPRRKAKPDSDAFRHLTEPMRAQFHRTFQNALLALDTPAPRADLPIMVSPDLQRRIAAEQRLRRRRRQQKALARKVRGLAAMLRMRRVADRLALALTGSLARLRVSRQV